MVVLREHKGSPNGIDQAWQNKRRHWRLQENNFEEIGGLLQVAIVSDGYV